MKNLILRTITGILLVALIVIAILKAGNWLFNIFFIFTCVGTYEYIKLLNIRKINISIWFYVVASIVYFIVGYMPLWDFFNHNILIMIIVVTALSLLVVELFRSEENPFENVAFSVLGLLWIVLPLALVNVFPVLFQNGKYLLLSIFIVIWLSDTLAYCVGSLIGKHKLFERVSPKKTWEGSIGSALITSVIAYFLPMIFPNIGLSNWQMLIMVLIIIVFGTFGDLIESLLKRNLNVKDSGFCLPGHGGILDRFDSSILAIPLVLLYLLIVI